MRRIVKSDSNRDYIDRRRNDMKELFYRFEYLSPDAQEDVLDIMGVNDEVELGEYVSDDTTGGLDEFEDALNSVEKKLTSSRYVVSSTVVEDLIDELEGMPSHKLPPVMLYTRLVRKAEQNGLERKEVGQWTVSQWMDYLKNIKSSARRSVKSAMKRTYEVWNDETNECLKVFKTIEDAESYIKNLDPSYTRSGNLGPYFIHFGSSDEEEVSQSKKFVKSSSDKDWMGIPGVRMIWHGEWADPEIEHDGVIANYIEVEENLRYEAENAGVNADDDAEFDEFIRKNKNLVYELIDEAGERGEIESGCHGKKKGKKSVKSARRNNMKSIKSSVESAIAELEEYFGRTANGDTIYVGYKITQDDEIQIGNICYDNNVDFALGTSHVTVYPIEDDEEIESGCHGKSDKRRRERKEDELESSRRRIKSSASLPITELDVEIGRNDKGDVVYKNTKFGTYRLLKADGRLEEVSMDGGRAESVLDKWMALYDIDYDDSYNIKSSRNAITFSKFNRISSLFIKNDRLVEGEECVIQIKDKNGRWEDVSYDREKPYWSIKGKPKMFSDEKTARKSALMKALNDAGYSEEAGNLQISMS